MKNKLYGTQIQLSDCNLHLHFHGESVVELDLINIRGIMPNGLLTAAVIDSCQML
jgi:hypothetical protein